MLRIHRILRRGVTGKSISVDYAAEVKRRLNQLCEYCGSLPVSQLSKGHIEHWVRSQTAWQSPVTRRNAITIVLAAFNHARDMHEVRHRLKGLKKPPSRPRLHSFTAEDEDAIYDATDEVFGDFLFAAIHTGLRPFCELARLTADDIAETNRGMMWRVYSSKTKKTRKIPVRREVAVRVRSLIQSAPVESGIPVFRNTQGNPWKKVTAGDRFVGFGRSWIGIVIRSGRAIRATLPGIRLPIECCQAIGTMVWAVPLRRWLN